MYQASCSQNHLTLIFVSAFIECQHWHLWYRLYYNSSKWTSMEFDFFQRHRKIYVNIDKSMSKLTLNVCHRWKVNLESQLTNENKCHTVMWTRARFARPEVIMVCNRLNDKFTSFNLRKDYKRFFNIMFKNF